ncbi:MAG: hypothetical protein HRU26_07715 [Psychroserpens sp.]|nr:hypothetical protein [Psychroserpens sp.]
MRLLKCIILILAVTFSTACKEEKKEAEVNEPAEQAEETTKKAESKITLTPLTDSPAYADAKLKLDTPETMVISQAGEYDFSFGLENYVLGEQTESINSDKLANSGKGQHIHFILNNQPYMAHYETDVKKELPEGVHHLVAFLSRSYHESVKNEESVIVRKLQVGKDPVDELGLDMNAPTLIYSRPKGTYVGEDAKNILLDFFVLNANLSERGYRVKASFNGETFYIDKWVPHVINGLPMGEVTVDLKLIDAAGNLVDGPFNAVQRTIKLSD